MAILRLLFMRSIYKIFGITTLFLCSLLIARVAFSTPEFTNVTNLRIGEVTINLPAPESFIETSKNSAELWKLAQSIGSGYSQTIAHYISKSDFDAYNEYRKPAFSEYFIVQTPKSARNLTATQQQFDQLRSETAAMQTELRKSIEPSLGKELDKLNKNLSSKLGKPLAIGIGQIIPVSVNINRPNLLSYSVLSQISISNKDVNTSNTMVLTTGICFLKGKVVMLNSYRLFQTPQDLQISREVIEKWANNLLLSNQ